MKPIVTGSLAMLLLAGCAEQNRSVVVQPITATPSQVWVAPSGEPTYPEGVKPEQRQLLAQLGDFKWFRPVPSKEYREQTQRQLLELLGKISNAGMPGLASPADIRVSKAEITNTINRDVLIVLLHETGQDAALRTHWLPAGKAIPNRSAFTGWGKVWVIAPNMKEDTEPQN